MYHAYIVLTIDLKTRSVLHVSIKSAPAHQITNMGNGTIHTQYGTSFEGKSFHEARENGLKFLKTYEKDLYAMVGFFDMC